MKLKKLIAMKARFAATSLAATGLDYVLYLLLVERFGVRPVPANLATYSLAVLVNFALQRLFVFRLERPLPHAFAGAMLVSGGGLLLSSGLIWGFNRFPFLAARQYLVKLLVTGLMFFYNFYFKRLAFEKRFMPLD